MPFNRYDLLSKCETVNIDSLQHGISKDLLPKLYQDAIDLTRALNKKYIWIDSLCIIQDSKEDWAAECERMSAIYSNCYMTISAMSYENNSRGFRHIRPEDVPPRHPLCALPEHPGTTVNVRSMVDHKSRKDYLKYRGWAFQELLLSPRVLHLTSTAMAFECDTCTVLERGADSDTLYGFDVNRKRFVFTTSREQSLEGLQDAISEESSSNKHYDRWLQLVQTHSQLKLTYNTDRLPALSGIASHVASKTQDVYVAGLWRNDIAAGLLWYVWPYQSTAPKYVAPSWSWASTAATWTLEPSRRRFVHLTINHVQTKLATSNPYGEISAASLTVSGPLKQCSAREIVKKGHRYFALKADGSNSVRFALDTGHTRDLRPNTFWCLDCTTNKTLDVEMAQSTMRRETFFRPHGLVLACLDVAKQTYKRVGVFEVYCIDYEASAWQNDGFEMATIHII
ncbi:hypothetical protein E8E13_006384 [Curvularia kusanoi]|uniref:Heterokaryon incompatibility domain-containing protein n=1 Tax=Curvularia kusanoi TaxID=90978 RepID=A0A9P4WD89_CURKU|nr:hypothetical protein E8E13_006384 [Curvularia kusanoi]